MVSDTGKEIILTKKGFSSSAITIAFLIIWFPLIFVLYGYSGLIESLFRLFVFSSLFIVFILIQSYINQDIVKVIINSNYLEIHIAKITSKKNKIIRLNPSNVDRIATYSPLIGGTGIKFWKNDGKYLKFRLIGEGSHMTRSLRFNIEKGPQILHDSLEPVNAPNNLECSNFLEAFLNECKNLGYKAEY